LTDARGDQRRFAADGKFVQQLLGFKIVGAVEDDVEAVDVVALVQSLRHGSDFNFGIEFSDIRGGEFGLVLPGVRRFKNRLAVEV
jgi:hypothetical protein